MQTLSDTAVRVFDLFVCTIACIVQRPINTVAFSVKYCHQTSGIISNVFCERAIRQSGAFDIACWLICNSRGLTIYCNAGKTFTVVVRHCRYHTVCIGHLQWITVGIVTVVSYGMTKTIRYGSYLTTTSSGTAVVVGISRYI